MVSCWGSGEVAGVIDTAVSQVRGQAVTGSNNSSHVDRTVLMTHGVLSVGGASSGQVSFVQYLQISKSFHVNILN